MTQSGSTLPFFLNVVKTYPRQPDCAAFAQRWMTPSGTLTAPVLKSVVLKDLSLEWAGKAICVSFHPGWVRTDMGGAGADITAQESVAGMRRVIAGLTPQDNGRFLNHDGSEIPW